MKNKVINAQFRGKNRGEWALEVIQPPEAPIKNLWTCNTCSTEYSIGDSRKMPCVITEISGIGESFNINICGACVGDMAEVIYEEDPKK